MSARGPPSVLAAFATVAVVLAGCGEPSSPSPNGSGGWSLDCSLGDIERGRGATWAQDCMVRASHTPGHKQEMWLVVNPLDEGNVVIGSKDLNPAASARCVWNGLAVTTDGGATWSDVIIGGPYASRTPQSPYYGYACNTDPMGVFTDDGTLYWLVEMYNLGQRSGYGPVADPTTGRGIANPGWKLVLARSHDGGLTWPDNEAVTLEYGDGTAFLNDYSRITFNPATGSIITAINTFYPGAGVPADLPDLPVPLPGQLTFNSVCSVLPFRGAAPPAQPAPIQPTFVTPRNNPGQVPCWAIAALRDGTIVVALTGPATPTGGAGSTAWFARSSDDGRTFGDAQAGFAFRPIPGQFEGSVYRTGVNVELVADNTGGPRDGTLYMMTAERIGNDDAAVVVRSSTDKGVTWSDPVVASVEQPAQGVAAGGGSGGGSGGPGGAAVHTHQFMGNLAVATDGTLHGFWFDQQYDPAHRLLDVTHGVSLDGGLTWATQRVTTVGWEGDLGMHQEDFPFIGDYNGVGAAGDTVWAGFPDGSNGSVTVTAAARVHK